MLQNICRLEHGQKLFKCGRNHLASMKCKKMLGSRGADTDLAAICGFRDTYLGRQVVSRPESGDGVSWGLGALRAPLAGFGAEPQPKSNLLPFSPKISHQVATISIIFNAMQTTNLKIKNIWGGNASPASPLNPPMLLCYYLEIFSS